jgi:hypothetical protein
VHLDKGQPCHAAIDMARRRQKSTVDTPRPRCAHGSPDAGLCTGASIFWMGPLHSTNGSDDHHRCALALALRSALLS